MTLKEFTRPLSHLATHFVEEWSFQCDETSTHVVRRFQMFPTRPATRPFVWVISLFFRRAIAKHMAQLAAITITRTQVMPLLREAAPGFEDAWRKHLETWGDEERGHFIDASEFANYVVRSCRDGNTSELAAVFAVIERILQNGDTQAKELAAIGVLEDIQTIASNEGFERDAFEGWLGPLSKKRWAEIDELWCVGGGSLAGVLRYENELRSRRK